MHFIINTTILQGCQTKAIKWISKIANLFSIQPFLSISLFYWVIIFQLNFLECTLVSLQLTCILSRMNSRVAGSCCLACGPTKVILVTSTWSRKRCNDELTERFPSHSSFKINKQKNQFKFFTHYTTYFYLFIKTIIIYCIPYHQGPAFFYPLM